MNTKKQLKKRIADLEKECNWINVERDMLKNDIKIQLLEKKKYINEINHLKKENEDIKCSSKNWFERYNREYDRAEELEDRYDKLYQIIVEYQKDLKNKEEIIEKLRKVACVGEMLNIMQNSLDLMKENEELKEKIKTLNDVITNAKLNLTIKDNEKYKLIKSILEKNTEISRLEDEIDRISAIVKED